ncbi:MAG TPA: hypothetical protein VKW08_10140, partial [Xanthobacteraceae bacterium]|nr:hypothetical protein [Xanthobacteraceae bacterium]
TPPKKPESTHHAGNDPAAFSRKRWPPSIGTHGRVQSESPAAIVGIRTTPEAEARKLLAGPLLKQFKDVYRGPISKAAERAFRNLIEDGENADPIIAASRGANPEMPADPKPLISEEAIKLGDELAVIAGQDLAFLEPGWCAAAYRCQQWLGQGWPRELIVAGVRSMVAQKRPEKISNVAYFEKGLARFIAEQRRPVPQVIEHQAQTVEVTRGKAAHTVDPRSGVAAIDRVYAKLRAAAEGQHGGGPEVSETPVHRLPA